MSTYKLNYTGAEINTKFGYVTQNMAVGASPTLTGLTLSGLTANRLIYTNGSKAFASAFTTDGNYIYSTGLKVGRDADNYIDWTTDNQITIKCNSASCMTINSSGNIGFGTTDIEAWHSSYLALEFYRSAIWWSKSDETLHISSNIYYDGAYKHKSADYVCDMGYNNGTIYFKTGDTDAADSTATLSTKIEVSYTGIGFFGVAPSSKYNLTSDATDLPSVIALANDLKDMAQAYGLSS